MSRREWTWPAAASSSAGGDDGGELAGGIVRRGAGTLAIAGSGLVAGELAESCWVSGDALPAADEGEDARGLGLTSTSTGRDCASTITWLAAAMAPQTCMGSENGARAPWARGRKVAQKGCGPEENDARSAPDLQHSIGVA